MPTVTNAMFMDKFLVRVQDTSTWNSQNRYCIILAWCKNAPHEQNEGLAHEHTISIVGRHFFAHVNITEEDHTTYLVLDNYQQFLKSLRPSESITAEWKLAVKQ
jgi:hypothetical protein